MANKDLKTRTTISNAVNTELLTALKEYSKETGIPISKLLYKPIKHLLESVKK